LADRWLIVVFAGATLFTSDDAKRQGQHQVPDLAAKRGAVPLGDRDG